jgi:predicted nucleic acid-binding protein
VDANVLLRFLTGEPKGLAAKAARLMARAEAGEVVLVAPALVIAEVLWVLKSFYQYTIEEIERVLVPLMTAEGIEVEDRDVLIQALGLAREKNVDFVDAVLALQAARHGEPVCSFDGDFKVLPAQWVTPS